MKINLGCGDNRIDGWDNYDAEVDITKPLPFDDNSVDVMFAEHVVEHVTPQQAWNFFDECLRVLKPAGVIRIAVPSVERIAHFCRPDYERFCYERGFATEVTKKASVKAIVFNHGHQSTWSAGVLEAFLHSVGFKFTDIVGVNESKHGIEGVNGHGKVIGDAFNDLETVVVEGVKP